MTECIIEKNSFNIEKINSQIEEYGRLNNINNNKISDIKAVIEEFLSNILFPNFDGGIEFSIVKDERGIVLSFCYSGADYMQKVTDDSFLSLKIIKSKSKEIKSCSKDGRLTIEFIM